MQFLYIFVISFMALFFFGRAVGVIDKMYRGKISWWIAMSILTLFVTYLVYKFTDGFSLL